MRIILQNNQLKILSILSALYIIIILSIIAFVKVADGYEISIYSAYPLYFWLLIIGAYLVGIFYCLQVFFNKECKKKYFLSIPIFTMIFTLIILILLPFFRGYAIFGRGDVLSHVGLMKDILNTGQFGDNWYPILHIFGVQFSEIANINIETVTMIIPVIFYLIYTIGIFFMGKDLFGKKIGFIIFLISLIPLFGPSTVMFAPSTLGLFLLPFMIYLFLKSIKEERYSFLFVLSALPFVIFHPLRGLFFIMLITIILFFINLYNSFKKNRGEKTVKPLMQNESFEKTNQKRRQWFIFQKARKNYYFLSDLNVIKRFFIFKNSSSWLRLLLFSSIIWSAWYILYESSHKAIWSLEGFFLQIFEPDYQVYGDIIQDFSPPLFYVLRIGIFRLGTLGIITLLALFFILIVLIIQKNDFTKIFDNKMQIKLLIFLFGLFNVTTILFYFIGSPGGYGRYSPYVIIFSTFLVGLLFYLLYNIDKKSFIKKYYINKFIYFLFTSIVFLSIFSLYTSPIVGKENYQVTHMELNGMEWTFEYRNDNLTIEEIQGLSQHRFYNVIYGTIDYGKNIRYKAGQIFDPHFGYDNNDTLGDQYGKNAYLITSKINKIRYQALYPDWDEAQFFTNKDFEKLNLDKSVNHIYNNNEFNEYFINA